MKKIDITQQPTIPSGWKIESHDKSLGKIDPTKLSLWLHEKQKTGYIKGEDLIKDLPKEVLNATVLDYLIKNPKLIPEDWKGRHVFFWGTIYRNSLGSLYVRSLYFSGGAWRWGGHWLGDDFRGLGPSAVLASFSPKSSNPSTSLDSLTLESRLKSLEEFKAKVEKIINLS